MKKLKKLKRLIAIIAATVLCSVSLISFNTNAWSAWYGLTAPGTEEYDDFMNGWLEFDDSGLFADAVQRCSYKEYSSNTDGYRMFCLDSKNNPYNGRLWGLRIFVPAGCEFTFTFSDETKEDEYNEIVKRVLAKYDDAAYKVSYNGTPFQWEIRDINSLDETFENAKQICSELKEQEIISDFTYYDNVYYVMTGNIDTISGYGYGYPIEYYDEIVELLNGLDTNISLELGNKYVMPYGSTPDELCMFYKLIRDELGLDNMAHLFILESESPAIATPIDLFNAEEPTTEEPNAEEPTTEEPTTEELTTEAEQTSEISTEPATEAPEDESNEAESEQDKETPTETSAATEAPTATEAESTAAASDSAPKTGRSGAGLAFAGLAAAASAAFALRKKER